MIFDENGRPVPEDPWSSIVDLMSALVLVLFLAVIFFVTNFSEVSAALEVERDTLATRSAALKSTEEMLKSANAQNLDLIAREERLTLERQGLISEKQSLLDEKRGLIAEREALVADKARLESEQASLIKDRDELAANRASLLKEQEALKAKQIRLLAEREELRTDRAKLLGDKEKLLGDKDALTSETEKLNAQVLALQAAIREASSKQANLMNSLASSFESANAQGVSVDREGGKIILKSEVLFSKGEAKLTEEGKQSIQQVSEGLLKVLGAAELRRQVEGIMVEGHTSSSGKYLKNLKLSSERAINTLEFLLSLPKLKKSSKETRALFFAGAFGESRPVLKRGTEDKVKSRRIEIRLLFNQSEVKSLANAISK